MRVLFLLCFILSFIFISTEKRLPIKKLARPNNIKVFAKIISSIDGYKNHRNVSFDNWNKGAQKKNKYEKKYKFIEAENEYL